MKVVRLETFHVEWGAGRNRSAWVQIWADAGLYSLGEASPMAHGNALRSARLALRPLGKREVHPAGLP